MFEQLICLAVQVFPDSRTNGWEVINQGLICIFLYFVKSETPLSLVLCLIRTHNLLIFGLTTKPSCLGARQEDSGLPKLLIFRVRWIVSITQALQTTMAFPGTVTHALNNVISLGVKSAHTWCTSIQVTSFTSFPQAKFLRFTISPSMVGIGRNNIEWEVWLTLLHTSSYNEQRKLNHTF